MGLGSADLSGWEILLGQCPLAADGPNKPKLLVAADTTTVDKRDVVDDLCMGYSDPFAWRCVGCLLCDPSPVVSAARRENDQPIDEPYPEYGGSVTVKTAPRRLPS